jgi:hypothetical protein
MSHIEGTVRKHLSRRGFFPKFTSAQAAEDTDL